MTIRLQGWVLALCALNFGAASPSAADFEFRAGGGVFSPWDGDTGYSVLAQAMGSTETRHWRFGGEFELRDYGSEFFGVKGVDVQSYHLRALTVTLRVCSLQKRERSIRTAVAAPGALGSDETQT